MFSSHKRYIFHKMFQQPACVLGNFKSTAIKTFFSYTCLRKSAAKELPNPIHLVDFYNIFPRCVCVRECGGGALSCYYGLFNVLGTHAAHGTCLFRPIRDTTEPAISSNKTGGGGTRHKLQALVYDILSMKMPESDAQSVDMALPEPRNRGTSGTPAIYGSSQCSHTRMNHCNISHPLTIA